MSSIKWARLSFRLRAGGAGALEEWLLDARLRGLAQRADDLEVVWRVPVPGYDLPFLATARHTERCDRGALADALLAAVAGLQGQVADDKRALAERVGAVEQRLWEELRAAGVNA